MAKQVIARSYFQNKRIKGVRVENGDTAIPDRAYMGCTALKTIYIPESVKRLGHAILAETEGVQITYEGTERQWRMLARPRTERRDATVLGAWDKAPYYHDAGTHAESTQDTIVPLHACKGLTVVCKKDGKTLQF